MANVLPEMRQEYFWAISVLEAVNVVSDRDHHGWNGIVAIHDRESETARIGNVAMLNGLEHPLILPQRHLDAVTQAMAAPAEDKAAGLVEATAYLGSQSIRLASPLADRVHMTQQEEVDLNAGLADVWIQERLAAVWRASDSHEILPDVKPDFSYPGGSPATSAARGLVSGLDSERTPAEICNQLLEVPPDRRWEAIVAMMPGGDTLSPDERENVYGAMLRTEFGNAVKLSDSGAREAATARATREVALLLRPAAAEQIRLAQDPALRPAGSAPQGQDHAATDAPAAAKQSERKGWRRILGR